MLLFMEYFNTYVVHLHFIVFHAYASNNPNLIFSDLKINDNYSLLFRDFEFFKVSSLRPVQLNNS